MCEAARFVLITTLFCCSSDGDIWMWEDHELPDILAEYEERTNWVK